ncbi:MAG: type II toxin-antitoxin system RelE/ParE family toxin [Acidaminococcaceae bacterium]|nr:type II toxin-antitoxin system RelE/ParE family toxin [Acidaminococcaceae bacterium]
MTWAIKYLPEAQDDLESFNKSTQITIKKAIKKVQQNPLPQSENGYGKPLGRKHGKNLTNFLKIKLLREGIRIVYKLVRTESQMLIVVIGIREDDEVYDIAEKRKKQNFNLYELSLLKK